MGRVRYKKSNFKAGDLLKIRLIDDQAKATYINAHWIII